MFVYLIYILAAMTREQEQPYCLNFREDLKQARAFASRTSDHAELSLSSLRNLVLLLFYPFL